MHHVLDSMQRLGVELSAVGVHVLRARKESRLEVELLVVRYGQDLAQPLGLRRAIHALIPNNGCSVQLTADGITWKALFLVLRVDECVELHEQVGQGGGQLAEAGDMQRSADEVSHDDCGELLTVPGQLSPSSLVVVTKNLMNVVEVDTDQRVAEDLPQYVHVWIDLDDIGTRNL